MSNNIYTIKIGAHLSHAYINSPTVYINVSQVILGYLSAVTKTDAKIVMVNLRDMANVCIERWQNRPRNRGSSTWTHIVYPGTDLKIKVKCKLGQNYHLRAKHYNEQHELFLKQTGFKKPKGYKKIQESGYYEKLTEWLNANPSPYKGFDYEALMVDFETASNQYVSMSQDEIDIALVENILLVPQEEHQE